jgi:hypothetical protein
MRSQPTAYLQIHAGVFDPSLGITSQIIYKKKGRERTDFVEKKN